MKFIICLLLLFSGCKQRAISSSNASETQDEKEEKYKKYIEKLFTEKMTMDNCSVVYSKDRGGLYLQQGDANDIRKKVSTLFYFSPTYTDHKGKKSDNTFIVGKNNKGQTIVKYVSVAYNEEATNHYSRTLIYIRLDKDGSMMDIYGTEGTSHRELVFFGSWNKYSKDSLVDCSELY